MHLSDSEKFQRRLAAAEGFLFLNLAERAIEELRRVCHSDENPFAYHKLLGLALRDRKRYVDALHSLEIAASHQPEDLELLMALAWCYKRTEQLPRSIEAMHRAYKAHPKQPIVLYNLACYYSLARDKNNAFSWLGRALRMEPTLRDLIPTETDFDYFRSDPDFQFLTHSPLA